MQRIANGRVNSPYTMPSEHLLKEIGLISKGFEELKRNIQQLWIAPPTIYRFSESLKHQSVALSEKGLRMKKTTNLNYAVAMLEPALQMNNVSRVSFKVNVVDWLAVGICLRNVISWHGYVCDGKAYGIRSWNSKQGSLSANIPGPVDLAQQEG